MNKFSSNEVQRYHINNMVGVDLKPTTSNPDESPISSLLDGISQKRRMSRILLDLFAVSLNPRVSKKGYYFDKKDGEIKFRPRGQIDLLLIDDFMTYFFESFSDIVEFNPDYIEIGGGEGFNAGRKYVIGETSGTMQFRYFDPELVSSDKEYASGSAVDNYFRQKINLKLSGDGLQVLREKGLLVKFLKRLYTFFECEVSMFDATCDLFNFDLSPFEFSDLYRAGKYLGKSTVNVMGDVFNPTVYIGKYKGARTIMLYDKLQEAKDKNGSDEPDLIEALKTNDGDWFRLEQHFSRDRKEASQAFNHLMFDVVRSSETDSLLNVRFNTNLANFLKAQVENKCRFLAEKRKEKNNERIRTNPRWQLILNAINDTKTDFAFQRPDLDLQTRKMNFIMRGIGGNNLFLDILKDEGETALLMFFIQQVVPHVRDLYYRDNDSEDDIAKKAMFDKVMEKLKASAIPSIDEMKKQMEEFEKNRVKISDDDLPF